MFFLEFLIRDLNLIQNESLRKDISNQLIANFIEKYKVYYRYLADYVIHANLENSIKAGKIKELLTHLGLEKLTEKDLSVYEIEEMASFLKQSLL